MKDKLWSVGKGALVAAAGAGLTYLLSWTGAHDLGVYTPIVVAVLSVAAGAVKKFAVDPATPAS